MTKLEDITAWLGLSIKPSKCRTFCLSKGRYRKLNIDIQGQTILNVEDAPSKFLGMQLSLSQSFRERAHIANQALQDIILPLNKFPLPPRDKVYIYKNFAVPKMRWVLLVQDVLPTALKKIGAQIERNLKQWWHLPRSCSRDALRLVTGIPSIADIAQQSQCIKSSIAQSSRDPNVKSALRSRRIHHYKPVRNLLQVLHGSIPEKRAAATGQVKAHQYMVLKNTVGKLLVQGAWSKLNTALATDNQWRSMMWSLSPSTQQFATKAALDVLPTRANLLRWKVGCDSSCLSCGVKETLHHTLNNCTTLLNAGAYTWRHNSILQHLLPHIQLKYPASRICADLPGHTYALPFNCDTAWRPDIVVLHKNHQVEFVELTIPFEPNADAAHLRKTTKYGPLLQQAKQEGLNPRLSCIEMGSRGLPSRSWSEWVGQLDHPRQITKECSHLALLSSHVVWIHRHTVWPNPPLMVLAV